MSSQAGQSSGWSRKRLFTAVVILFLAQVAFITWFNRPFAAPRRAAVSPSLRLSGGRLSDWLLLNDPTLFALPHQKGFAGPAWLQRKQLVVPLFDRTERRRYLPYQPDMLGLAVQAASITNTVGLWPALARPEPPLTMPTLPISSPFEGKSVLRLSGDLGGRRLITSPDLPDMPHPEILTNTLVQVVVDAEGRPFSWTLLQPGSGLKTADDYALERVRLSRFEPLPAGKMEPTAEPGTTLTWGYMIFQWHTVRPTSTNAPAAAR